MHRDDDSTQHALFASSRGLRILPPRGMIGNAGQTQEYTYHTTRYTRHTTHYDASHVTSIIIDYYNTLLTYMICAVRTVQTGTEYKQSV